MSRSRKSRRKLNSLFMVLVLTGMLLLASTYAWFSANRVVELTGINAKVSAAEGLQISLDGKKWSSKLTINQETLAAATENKYQWPTELVPVSTTGATTGGNLDLYYGDVVDDGANLNGTEKQTDPSTGSTAGKYIVFDLYFKNASSKTTDNLLIRSGSEIKIASDGVEGTGLENCVRTAVVLWGGNAAMTASDTTVRAIEAGAAQKVCIWEPFYLSHITEVTTNDSRVSGETADAPFKTLGIKKTGNLTGINGTSATEFMDVQKTLTTTGGTIGTDTQMPNLGTTGDLLALKGNSIMKARIYIWLEGQDPDCIDTASTGKSIDVALSFTKPGVDAAATP